MTKQERKHRRVIALRDRVAARPASERIWRPRDACPSTRKASFATIPSWTKGRDICTAFATERKASAGARTGRVNLESTFRGFGRAISWRTVSRSQVRPEILDRLGKRCAFKQKDSMLDTPSLLIHWF
jgi:hypothetical protein